MSNNLPKTGEFCWNELMTPDTQKAKTFYCELFGWKTIEHDIGHMVYTMFKNGEKDVGGMLKTPPSNQEIPPHWLNYIAVDNIDSMLEKAVKLGAKIKMPKTPVADYGEFAVLEDPTGACFALWKSLKSC